MEDTALVLFCIFYYFFELGYLLYLLERGCISLATTVWTARHHRVATNHSRCANVGE
jgi:hypothetical protein